MEHLFEVGMGQAQTWAQASELNASTSAKAWCIAVVSRDMASTRVDSMHGMAHAWDSAVTSTQIS